MMKRICLLIWLAVAMIFFSGCDMAGDMGGDLKDSELAAALTVDRTDGGVTVGVELLHRDRALERQYKDSYYHLASEGQTLAAAVEGLHSQGARQINFAHIGLLVLGREAAMSDDWTDWTDWAMSLSGLRPTVYPVIAEEGAADFFGSSEDLSAVYLLQNALEPSGGMLRAEAVTLQDFVLCMEQSGIAAALPYVRSADVGGKGVGLSGMAVYDGEGWQFISDSEALAWKILTRGRHIGGEVLNLGNGVSVKLRSAEVKSEVEGQSVCYNLRLCGEVTGNPAELTSEEVERRLTNKVRTVLEYAVSEQRKRGVDYLGLGREIWRNEPTLWAEMNMAEKCAEEYEKEYIIEEKYLSAIVTAFTVEAEVESGEI